MPKKWEIDEITQEIEKAIESAGRYLAEKDKKKGSPMPARQSQPARPVNRAPAASSDFNRSDEWYRQRQAAMRDYDRRRAAAIRRQQLEELDPLLRAADEEIAFRTAESNYAVAKALQDDGKPIPKALLASIRRDLDYAKGQEPMVRRERRVD